MYILIYVLGEFLYNIPVQISVVLKLTTAGLVQPLEFHHIDHPLELGVGVW